jgi:pimeloyl-ACP methyl ester carboxylesterase
MDAIRTAVGDEKTTYLGFSYGTLLGATYAQLFPDKIRALVLDGADRPRSRTSSPARSRRPRGFEPALHQLHHLVQGERRQVPDRPGRPRAVTDALAKADVVPGRGHRTVARPPPAGSSSR